MRVLPTPGHTMGSVTYLLERGGERIAFTGDLIYAPGKVWSLAATQWSYTQNEGPAMTVLSAILLGREDLVQATQPGHFGERAFATHADGTCVHLGTPESVNACQIYEIRGTTCREFERGSRQCLEFRRDFGVSR